jgi:hypothetical protein
MPFSSGTFSLYTPGNPVVTGTTIASTWANNTLTDLATGLSTCVLKDGTQTMTANIPMAGFKFTGLGAGTASGHSMRYEQVLGVATTAGDTLYATAAGTLARAATLKSVIYGFTYANNGTDSIDVAAGGAMDSTSAYWMTGAALTKNITAAWAVGTAAGMLDTGAVGNSDYYLWVIARTDTGVVDYLASLSSTAPTMPANYTMKRLIGWFKRVGGTNVAFHTYETEGGGLEMMWDSPTLDLNLANTLTTARRTDAVKVPLNFSVTALLNVEVFDASSVFTVYVYCPDMTDIAPAAFLTPLSTFGQPSIGVRVGGALSVRTSSAGLIAARADIATVDLYAAVTLGFRWARRV